MEETIVDRFLKVPTLEGISKNKFEASIGKASGYFNVLKKRGSVPAADLIQTFVSTYPEYSLRWIIMGEGSPKERGQKREYTMVMEEPDKYLHPGGMENLFRDLLLEGLKNPEVRKEVLNICKTGK